MTAIFRAFRSRFVPHAPPAVALFAISMTAAIAVGHAAALPPVEPRRAPAPRPAEGFAPTVASLLRDPRCADVVICSHRGNGAGAPENSLAAIRGAAAAGALVIEVDVRETKDDALVLMHDSTVDRTTRGARGKLSDLTLAEVRKLRLLGARSGEAEEAPPLLAEAIEAARGRAILQLDLKTSRMDLVARALADAGAHGFVTCGKGSFKRLVELRGRDPRIELIPRAASESDLDDMLSPSLAPVAIQIPEDMLTQRIVGRIRATGVRVWVNALGVRDLVALLSPTTYDSLLAGADIIQTDRVPLLAPRARAASLARYPH